MPKHPLTVTIRCEMYHTGSTRFSMARCSYQICRIYKRGRAFSALMAASMLLFGRNPRHRIYT